MKSQDQKQLLLIQALSEDVGLSQRDLFLRLGMAQGLVNRYLKRMVQKGWIKLSTAPPKRMLYWLTPKGLIEKTRLTYEFVTLTYTLYREAHRNASNKLHALAQKKHAKRIVVYGAEPVAEVASLSFTENKLKLTAVIDEDLAGQKFLEHKVGGIDDLDRVAFDAILFCKHSRRDDKILLKLLATKGHVVSLFD